ncbi:Dynein heavy chain, partial [Globisporangium splendens]
MREGTSPSPPGAPTNGNGAGSGISSSSNGEGSAGALRWTRMEAIAPRNGELPSRRSGHSLSTAGSKGYLLGGCDCSKPPGPTNNLFVLKINTNAPWEWEKLKFAPATPLPRWKHSATVVDNKVYVFGGSHNSSTRFNDLWVFNPITMEWSQPMDKGSACAPSRRLEDLMLVCGGWNSVAQFNDLHVFDTTTNSWLTIEGFHMANPLPRWNHAACAVPAIPHVKVFNFGGAIGEPNNYNGQGTVPEIRGTPPYGRSDTTLAYDDKGSRLVIFGGWANVWLNDLFCLDYGPITGGTQLILEGIDFMNKPVAVRFSCRKGSVDVKGEHVNDHTLYVATPDFTSYPPGDVQIRIALQGDSFTTTFQTFNFFAVTDASMCFAYGPGVLGGGASGEPTCFIIQARDANCNLRTRGGDELIVEVSSDDTSPLFLPTLQIQDLVNGKYLVSYTVSNAGEYKVNVEFQGTFGGVAGSIRGVPFTASFDDTVTRDMNLMTGKLVLGQVLHDLQSLQQFSKECNLGLEQPLSDPSWTPEQTTNVLIRLKEHVFHVEKRGEDVSLSIDELKAEIAFLKDAGIMVTKEIDMLSSIEIAWNDILRKVPAASARIPPLTSAQSLTFRNETAFEQEEANFERQRHIAEILECKELIEPCEKVLNAMRKTAEHAHQLWGSISDVTRKIDLSKEVPWSMIDGIVLEEEAKGFMTMVKATNKDIRDCDAACPLFQALRHPPVRKRHWPELVEVAGKTFDCPDDNPALKFADVLALNLHEFQRDVEEITDRAQKKAKQESVLQDLESRWSTVSFTMTRYKETDVSLLHLSEDIAEMLESHQLLLQAMVSGRHNCFQAQTQSWYSRLMLVSEIVGILSEIQRSWSCLEPLFMRSEETKRELPAEAVRSQQIDERVRQTLRLMWSQLSSGNALLALPAGAERILGFQAALVTLRGHIVRSLLRLPEQNRVDWLMQKLPASNESDSMLLPMDAAQVALLVADIEYAKGVENSFVLLSNGHATAMNGYYEKIVIQLNDLVKLTQTNLTKQDHQRAICLITIDAHSRDVVQKLLFERITSSSSTYLEIYDATFDYGFEYLGNGPRLVITPLTDRIYVTATQALHIQMGCDPAGPAGTGKTETTKDLANMVGKICYMFNCSPEMNYKNLGNIFKGLASAGAWGCFDEFNRLAPEVLSVRSVRFKAVCDGIRSDSEHITIEGDTVKLDPTCAKSVLVVAGSFKRTEPKLAEQEILMRFLRDFNLPKIAEQDLLIFNDLLEDLFPQMNPPRKVDEAVEEFVHTACEERGFWPHEQFRLKVIQLEELLAIRHCVFVMGLPGSGKAECCETLAAARKKKGDDYYTKVVDLNPKTVSTEELYGYMVLGTREWKDGLLSKLMRDVATISMTDLRPKWLVLDGDLDANWIESMNSVMDDNKMLTLAPNERIPLKPNMRLLFEIRDLKFATPATVSRAGILYISNNDGSQWRSFLASWVGTKDATLQQRSALGDAMNKYIDPIVSFIRQNCKTIVPMEDITMVQTYLYFLDTILDAETLADAKKADNLSGFISVWAFGAGAFTKPFRDLLILERWIPFLCKALTGSGPHKKDTIPMFESCSPLEILTSDSEITAQNTRGIYWLREMEKHARRASPSSFQVVRQDQANFTQLLETAVEHGHSLLVENMTEEIEVCLWPVISRTTATRGHKTFLKLGDKLVEFHADFRLYLHTKLSNPHYPPELQAEATMINFAVTQQGLEDQLLSSVVRKEWPKKTKVRTALMHQQNEFKIRIQALEDRILTNLADAEGDITENVQVITDLETTKATAVEIAMKAAKVKEYEAQINALSSRYQSSAAKKVIATQRFQWNADLLLADRVVDSSAEQDLGAMLQRTDQEEMPTPAQIEARCRQLKASITEVVFNYIRRRFFESDKLTLATQLHFAILQSEDKMQSVDIHQIVTIGTSTDPSGPGMGILSEWLRVRKLEENITSLQKLTTYMKSDAEEWREWYDSDKPEVKPLPGPYETTITPLQLLHIVRVMRSDRMIAALQTFLSTHLGTSFIQQPPFDMEAAYQETSASTLMFFVLFPGVDPISWVENLGKKFDFTYEHGNLINISMGQGQESMADSILMRFSREGNWVILQNIHLMQSWLPKLERTLELYSVSVDQNFRCFLSAEAPALASLNNLPELLLQSCIKVANEAPTDLKSNLRHAWANLSLKQIEECSKPSEYQGCLFALCFFHVLVLGCRRFGFQGWSRIYSFNTGDLLICSDVLRRYLENTASASGKSKELPWDDLRYIFGEIMYGGHITDHWDRITNNAYLLSIFTPEILTGKELAPGFKCPDPMAYTYTKYGNCIESELPMEAPMVYGLHSNAEVGYLSDASNELFLTIAKFQPASSSSSEPGDNPPTATQTSGSKDVARVPPIIESLLDQLPAETDLQALQMRAAPLLSMDQSPYVVVALQEAARMNALVNEIHTSLTELMKGINGTLNMTESMEDLLEALSINQVPGRNVLHLCSWERFAWWSRKSLAMWYADFLERVHFLTAWTSEFRLPYSVWISDLFNPTAFHTAIKQCNARKHSFPLDSMTIETHFTTVLNPEAAESYPDMGAYIRGLYVEGAHWELPVKDGEKSSPFSYEIDGIPCGGHIMDPLPKELFPETPVVYARAVVIDEKWEATSVGYFRRQHDVFDCPVYQTTQCGPTYVFLATLNTTEPKSKWILAGLALMMQKDA